MASRLSLLGVGKQAAVSSWWLSGGISEANAIIVYQPKGAASLDASYTNLANPGTYDAKLGVAPTWNATDGWIFDGISQTLKPGYTSQSNHTFIVRFSGAANTNGNLFYSEGGGAHRIAPRWAGLYVNYKYSSNDSNVSPILTDGILATAGTKAYRNGVDEGITLDNSGAGGQIWIASKYGTDAFYAVKIQAFAIYNTVLSQEQMTALNTAMAAL